MPQALYLVVYAGILFYERIRVGDVRLRLIIVIIGYEILNCIIGKEFFEFRAELRRKRLIMSKDKCRPLKLLYDLGHGKGLTRAGHAQKRLLPQPALHSQG